MSKGTSRKIHLLGFAMTVGMVLYHFSSFKPAYFINAFDEKVYIFFSKFCDLLGIVAMSYFFTMTGFLLYYGMNRENIGKKVKSRIFSLLLPYCIWNGLYYVFYLLIYGKNYLFSIKEMIERFVFYPFDAPLWYLLTAFIYALFSPILIRGKGHLKIGIVIFIAIIIGMTVLNGYSAYVIREIPYGGYVERLCRYLPNYATGVFVGIYFPQLIGQKTPKRRIEALTLFVLLACVWVFFEVPYTLSYIIQRCLPVFLWFAIPEREKDCGQYSPCHATFMIYAMHAVVIFLIEHIAEDWFTLNGVSAVGIRLVGTAFIIGYIWGIWFLMKKWTPKGLALLTGNRW